MSYTTNPNMLQVRKEAVKLIKQGWSARQVGRYLGYHHTAIMKWMRKAPSDARMIIPTLSSKPHSHPKALDKKIIYDYAGNSLKFVKQAQHRALFNFNYIQSDHGPEFSQHFTERVKIKHRHSRVRKPTDNAYVERFNRTIQEELIDRLPRNIKLINKELRGYLRYYNNERLHLGLGLKTPQQWCQAID